jgi:hypothetical protein
MLRKNRPARRPHLLSTAALTACAIAAALGGAPPSLGAGTVTAVLAGSAQSTSSWTLGLNGENNRGPTYSTTGFADAIAAYHPGTLRYPGGTAANFWDWHRGWYQPNGPWSGQPSKQIDNSLATFASIARRVGATPVFDVNVVTWNGRIATDSDVPSMISDTLDLLRAADAAGIPVRRIELGNELYLGGPSPGTTQYQQRFRTAAGYAAVAERFTAAITQAFPKAKVAACAAITDYVNGLSNRRKNWNGGLLPNLDVTPAVTLHLNVRVHDATASPAAVLGVMVRQMRALNANELPLLRQYGLDAWVTEFNMADQTAGQVFQGTWLHGVAVGTLALSLVALPGVSQFALHNVTGRVKGAAIFGDKSGFGSSGPTTTPYALTASGAVLSFVQDALRGASTAQKLAFLNAPPLGWRDAPGVMGMIAEAGAQSRVVLINLTGQTASIDVSEVLSSGFSYRRAWAASISTKVAGPGDVMRNSGTARGAISLPPYAVAMLTS